MLILDAALRFSAITLLLLVALLSFRDARNLLQGRIAIALCLSLSAMLINTLVPSMYGDFPDWVIHTIWFIHIPNIVLLWLFGLSLYEDEFQLRPLHWAVFAGIFAALLINQLSLNRGWDELASAGYILNRCISFGVLIHLMWTAVSGRKDDLVERRRRTRWWFTLGIAITALLVISGETAQFVNAPLSQDPAWMSTLRVATIWPMVLFGAVWFLSIQPENFRFEQVTQPENTKPSINPKDRATYDKLTNVMESGAFKEQGLTIRALSDQIAVPEHQLRALINQGLGHRNFSSFLNRYRLDYAKGVLSDPEKARLPVLTIAMDAGFNSLAPFNRAFKSEEGVTPSAYRAEHLSDPEKD